MVNANATNTGQIVQYIALNPSVCSVVLRKEIQIIHRLFLVFDMYCQAPSMSPSICFHAVSSDPLETTYILFELP